MSAPQSAQGDARFGDVRFRGKTITGAAVYAYYPYGSTGGGELFVGTQNTFYVNGGYPDLYSVILHETGHSLGRARSTVSGAVMDSTMMGVYSGLSADDIAGI